MNNKVDLRPPSPTRYYSITCRISFNCQMTISTPNTLYSLRLYPFISRLLSTYTALFLLIPMITLKCTLRRNYAQHDDFLLHRIISFPPLLASLGCYIDYVATLAYDATSLNWIVLSTLARQQPGLRDHVWQEKDKQTRTSTLMTEIYSNLLLLLLIGT